MLYYSHMQTVQEIEKIIVPILRKHGVTKASLFGSVVTGKMHERSDVDILVHMPSSSSLLDRSKIKTEIEDALQKPVDVVRIDGIQSHARESILSSNIPLTL